MGQEPATLDNWVILEHRKDTIWVFQTVSNDKVLHFIYANVSCRKMPEQFRTETVQRPRPKFVIWTLQAKKPLSPLLQSL